jgi:antitoxin component YwqK of YwqJK toxin-antitoxin module
LLEEVFEGEWKFYDDTGQLLGTGEYLNGKPYNGKFMAFQQETSAEGETIEISTYLNGKIVGVEQRWYYENGQLAVIENLASNGLQSGESKRYYENGQLGEIGNFLDGKQIGLWKAYDRTGKLTETKNYDNNGYLIETKN